MKVGQDLNRILIYLDSNRSTFPTIEEVHLELDIEYSRDNVLRLEKDGFIEVAGISKCGSGYRITKKGEHFLNLKKGYVSDMEVRPGSGRLRVVLSLAKDYNWLITTILAILGIIVGILF